MPGNYTITSRSTGTVLTATIYNADHQNHVDNQTPQGTDDYSANASQMQSTADPGEVGSESLATSTAGELERLRFAIQEIKTFLGATAAQWYATPLPTPNSQSAAYTTVLGDANKVILHPLADTNNRTFTIDSNTDVPHPPGTTLTFINEVNTLTIAIDADTLTLAGTASTGSRTLAADGIATAVKVSSTKWIIAGVGLT